MTHAITGRRSGFDAIDAAARRLSASGVESAWLDAELLMAAAAGVTRAEILAGGPVLSSEILARFDAMLARREKREPLAYVVGHKEFYSLDFEVGPAVLIPRPETELAVAAALKAIESMSDPAVIDIGTGSGAIAIAIAANASTARVTATDISADALAIAARNASRHRVAGRVTFRRADCFEVLDGDSPLERFDLIVSNPPYIDDESIAGLAPEVRGYEPQVALGAGADGATFFRRIASGARAHLQDAGELIVEVGAGQAAAVADILEQAGLRVASVLNDLAGIPRVVRARTAGNMSNG
jgi:release factor glutamine methyltransferase